MQSNPAATAAPLAALPLPLRARRAGADDAAFLRLLYRSTRADLLAMQADAGFVEQLVDMQHRLQLAGHRSAHPDAVDHVIEIDGQTIGRALVDVGAAGVELVDLALLPHARGAGHGTALLRTLQQYAAAAGLPLGLSVNPANTVACRLYARLGFRTTARDATCARLAWNPLGEAA